MNLEVDTWEAHLLRLGIDPGSQEEEELVHTAWACGFEEGVYRLDI